MTLPYYGTPRKECILSRVNIKLFFVGFLHFFNRVIAIFSYQMTPCQGADTNALMDMSVHTY